MRWLLAKAINIPIVLILVLFILVSLTGGILDQIMMKTIQVQVRREVLSNPKYAYLSQQEKLKIIKRLEEELIKAWGLDKPWYIKAFMYMYMLFTFKPIYARVLTTRIINPGSPNAYLIVFERIPFTVVLFTTASIFTLAIAIPLALLAARRPGGIVDKIVSAWSVFSVSMPWWWFAMVMIWLFCYKFPIFAGPEYQTNWTNPLDVAYRAALPVLTVTVLSVGVTAYRIRGILLDVMREDFVTTARAKGLPEKIVLLRYVIRVAAPPIITIVLLSIVMSVVTGAILTEAVFNWYGMGLLYWEAVMANDIPVILVLTYISTLLYLITRFILDILYTYLDPRIRRA